jgi:hypothetical protein
VSRDLEEQLRAALRPLDPAPDFTARVLARLAAQRGGTQVPRAPRPRRVWVPLALAASLAGVLALSLAWHEWRARQGLEARRQLIQALRVTSEELDLAYRIVNAPPQSADPAGA